LIDNPAGIGYSFGKRAEDTSANDDSNGEDALKFMLQFYKDFPEYMQRPFYIAGISYGGVYAPIMAMKVH
jgi:carboxypeptidase C (cathepsin A)